VRDLLILAAAFCVLYLGYLASIVTVPLLLAGLFAYLFEPLVRWLTRWDQLSRPGVAAGIIAASALAVLIPLSAVVTLGVQQGIDLVAAVQRDVERVALAYETGGYEAGGEPEGIWKQISDELLELKREASVPVDSGGVGPGAGGAGGDGEVGLDAGGGGDGGGGVNGGVDGVGGGVAGGGVVGADETGAGVAEGDDEDEGLAAVGSGGEGLERRRATLLLSLYETADGWVRENRERIQQRVVGTGVDAAGWVWGGLTSVGVLSFQAFLTAFFFFFICTGWGKVLEFWERLIPERKKGEVVDLIRQMDRVVSGFVRGRLTIMVIQCLVFSVGYSLIGVPAGIFVGIAVGVLSVVPYLALVGIPISVALMLSAGPTEGFRAALWWQVGAPVAFYFVGQALDDYIWTPLIQGKSTDLDTPTVLFASIAGGALAGVYGLLIAIPVAACIKILVRELLWPRLMAWAAGDTPDPLPIGRRTDVPDGDR